MMMLLYKNNLKEVHHAEIKVLKSICGNPSKKKESICEKINVNIKIIFFLYQSINVFK